MHLLTPLLLATSISALAIFRVSDTTAVQSPIRIADGDDARKIPGLSPLEHCTADFANDIVTIERVDLSPNPPLPGQPLTIEATGTVSRDIVDGAYVKIQVKYGLIKLLSTTSDLCEQIANVDMECPVKKGPMTITKEVELPAQIPPGKYTVTADVYNADDEHITCLTATVYFSASFGGLL